MYGYRWGSEQMFGGDKSGEEPQEKHHILYSTHIKRATSFIVKTWQGKVNAPIIVKR